jgi:hypothetical protein
MAELTSKQRNALAPSKFALPKEGKYPIPDKAHARNALARASQMVKAGKLSSSSAAKVRAKAHAMLNK